MTDDALKEAAKDLRTPYKQAILRAILLSDKNFRDLTQVIAGPPCSGKTTEARAFANALAKAKIVEDKPPVCVHAAELNDRDSTLALFKSAEKGVLIIDDIDKVSPKQEPPFLSRYLLQALDDPKCVLILTVNQPGFDNFLKECSPELRARLPKPIVTERTFSAGEMRDYQNAIALREETERREKAMAEARARSIECWRQLSDDVTLKRPITPMKGVILTRKNETVT